MLLYVSMLQSPGLIISTHRAVVSLYVPTLQSPGSIIPPALAYPCPYPYHLFLFLSQSLALSLIVTGEPGMRARVKVREQGVRLRAGVNMQSCSVTICVDTAESRVDNIDT